MKKSGTHDITNTLKSSIQIQKDILEQILTPAFTNIKFIHKKLKTVKLHTLIMTKENLSLLTPRNFITKIHKITASISCSPLKRRS